MKSITKEMIKSYNWMEELYRELCELFGEVVGSKTQTYEMLNYYRNNYITEVCELNRAIDEIIDGDLLYQKKLQCLNYRVDFCKGVGC